MAGQPEIWTLDIETRPNEVYSWQLYNQNHSVSQIIRPAGILCFAARKYGTEKVHFYAEWTKGGYDRMVEELYNIYDSADWVVTFNGANFDSKWIKAAFVQAGLPTPSPYREVDLYRTVRKHFNFPSRKLTYVCGVLGLDVKVETGGQKLWNEVIRPTTKKSGDQAKRLMRQYNANDVVITEQLFERLRGWIDGLNFGVYVDDEQPVCANCGSQKIHRRGYAYTTVGRYRRFRCEDCGRWHKARSVEATTAIRA